MSIIRAGDAALVDTVTRDVGLVALVTNASTHAPVSGVRVNWRVVGQQDGWVDTGYTLTNASGVARQTWTLGPVATTQTVVARAVDAATGDSLALTPFAIAAVADSFSYFSLDATAIQVGVNQKVDVRSRIGKGFDRNNNLVASTPGISITADSNWVFVGDSAYSPVTTHAVIRYSAGTWSAEVAAMATTPGDSLSTVVPWLLEDYSSYTSTASLMSDPRGIYSVPEDETPGQIFLDTSTGYGGSKSSMRYDFPQRAGLCTDYGIGRNLSLPAASAEVWLEVVARFQAGFATKISGCASNADYKFILPRVYTSGRFNLMVGTYGTEYTFGYPGGEDNWEGGNAQTVLDGRWHTYRMHLKVGPAGTAKLWVDGAVVKDYGTVAMASNLIYGIALGRNINQGPTAPQSIWWGRIAVYNTNPGW